MKCEQRKDISICLIALAASYLLFIVFQNVVFLTQATNQLGVYLYDGLVLGEIGLLVYFAFNMSKLNYKFWCRLICFLELTLSLFYWAAHLLFSFGINNFASPFYYLSMSFGGITLALRILLLIIIKKNRCKEMSGLILFKNLNIVHLIYLSSFIIGSLFVGISKISLSNIPSDVNEIPQWLFIGLTTYITLSFVCLLVVAYFMFTLLLSSFENKPVELFRKFKYSLYIFKKYHLTFWFNAIIYSFLMIISLVSAIFVNTINFALALFFMTILLTRILNFAIDVYLKKKDYDDETHFRKRHLITLYCALILMTYAILQIFFGNASMVNSNEKSNHNLIVTLIVVVPWAIIKIVLGILKNRLAKKSGDPVNKSEAGIVGLITLYTLNNVMFSIGIATQNGVVLLIGLILTITTAIYCFVAGLLLLIISIKGLNNKREKELGLYLEYRSKKHQKDQLLLEELDSI